MKIFAHRKFPRQDVPHIPRIDNTEWVTTCRDFGYLPIESRKKLMDRILAIRNMLDDNAKNDASPNECLERVNAVFSRLGKHSKHSVGYRKPVRASYLFSRTPLNASEDAGEMLTSKMKKEFRTELLGLEKQLADHYKAEERGADFLVEAWMSQWNWDRDVNYWGQQIERLRSEGLIESSIIGLLEEEWYERCVESDQDDGPLFDDAMLRPCVGVSQSDELHDDCAGGPYGNDFLHPEFVPDFE